MAPVATQQAPSMLNRVDRLDIVLGHLEEKHGGRRSGTRSSATSTNSSGLLGSDYGGGDSSVTSSPRRSFSQRQCRSIEEAMVEMQVKGTLFYRIEFLENHILKLEEEMETERKVYEKESDGWRSPKATDGGVARSRQALEKGLRGLLSPVSKEAISKQRSSFALSLVVAKMEKHILCINLFGL